VRTVDLNCDMGESYGVYHLGRDSDIMPLVSAANIACGFHAGDPLTMQTSVRMAVQHKVAIGAHPGYPDLVGFGRRSLAATPEEVYAMVVYQVGAISAVASAAGGRVRHVKPHGALYNTATQSMEIAKAIATAVRDVDDSLILYGLSGSALVTAGRTLGLVTASEVFADRTYQPDGSLTPRRHEHALIRTEDTAVLQVLQMIEEGTVRAVDGTFVRIQADTVCIHGDGVHALEFATRLRSALGHRGIAVRAPEASR